MPVNDGLYWDDKTFPPSIRLNRDVTIDDAIERLEQIRDSIPATHTYVFDGHADMFFRSLRKLLPEAAVIETHIRASGRGGSSNISRYSKGYRRED